MRDPPDESDRANWAVTVSPRSQSRSAPVVSLPVATQAVVNARASVNTLAGVSSANESARISYSAETAWGRAPFPQARVCSSTRSFTSSATVSAVSTQSALVARAAPSACT